MHTADTTLTALESLAADILTRCETIRSQTLLHENARLHRASAVVDDAKDTLAEIARDIPLI